MDRTTLTRNLKPLTAQGWVFIAQEEDQRVKQVGLPNKGRAIYKKALPLWRGVQTQTATDLGKAGWASVMTGLHDTVDVVRSP